MVGAYCPYVSGPVEVFVNLRDGGGFVGLGYTIDGVQLEETFFTNPVHSDQYGGTAGPPVDRQFMGKSARLSLSMATYSLTVAKKLREGQASTNWATGVPGTLVNIGGLVTCSNAAFQVLLIGAQDTAAYAANSGAITIARFLNLPNCWYDGPVKLPIGAKNTVFDFDISVLPFTSDTTNGGDGITRLWTETNHLITYLNTYAGSAN